MIFLVLAIACSTSIAVLFKVTEGRYDRTALLTVNYAAAVAVAGFLLVLNPPARGLNPEPSLLLLGFALGVLFIAGFGLFSKAIGVAGMSLATATMRLSVALPFLASWLVWGEVPGPGQTLGLLLAGGAFLLISRPSAPATSANIAARSGAGQPRAPLAAALLLAMLFLAGGLVDTSLKLFEEEFAGDSSRPLFLLVVFAVAFMVGAALVGIRRARTGTWPASGVIGWGLILGVVNYGSAEFMLLALRRIPGTIAFPANNVAVVALATLLGITFWKEQPSRANQLGLVLAVAALALLSLP